MKLSHSSFLLIVFTGFGMLASSVLAQTAPAAPVTPATVPAAKEYKVIQTGKATIPGSIDYVYADAEGRRLYVPSGGQVMVFDLDTLKPLDPILNAPGGHGVAVDPKYHTAFCSSNPIAMWDSQTLKPIKTIVPSSSPDGIMFEPFTDRIYVISHGTPGVTVVDAKDGNVAGNIDVGGNPEQAQSDGKGHVYMDEESGNKVAVIDVNAMKVTATYDLAGKGTAPAGLGLDIKNHLLFVMCRNPSPGVCVIMDANDGKILDTQPLAGSTDGGGFNPVTMEAFSSQGSGAGTLSIIKENSPMSFAVGQVVATKSGAKTSTLDSKTGHIIVIATEALPAAAAPAAISATGAVPATVNAASAVVDSSVSSLKSTATPAAASSAGSAGSGPVATATPPADTGARGRGGRGGRGGPRGPQQLDILVVGQ